MMGLQLPCVVKPYPYVPAHKRRPQPVPLPPASLPSSSSSSPSLPSTPPSLYSHTQYVICQTPNGSVAFVPLSKLPALPRKKSTKKTAFVKELELTRKRVLDSFLRYTGRTHIATNYKDVKNVDCQLCLSSLKFKVSNHTEKRHPGEGRDYRDNRLDIEVDQHLAVLTQDCFPAWAFE